MEPKDKQQAVEEMLSKGDTMICLDSGYPEVRVPENHKGKEDLRLVLSPERGDDEGGQQRGERNLADNGDGHS